MKLSSTMMNDIDFERRVKDAFAYWTIVEREDRLLWIQNAWEALCLDKTLEGEKIEYFNFICDRLNIEPEVLNERRKYFNLSFFSEEEE